MQSRIIPVNSHRFRRLALAGVILLTGACSDDLGSTPSPSDGAAVATVELSPAAITLATAESQHLAATLRSASGTQLTGRPIAWQSSNDAVVRVSEAGTITGQGEGTATVTATSGSGRGQVEITVRDRSPVPVLSAISPATVVAEGSGFTMTLTGSGFSRHAWVRINSTPLIPTFVSETELRVEVGSNHIMNPAEFSVTVLNLSPGGGLSGSLPLTVVPHPEAKPQPVLSSISPTTVVAGSGPQTVTLRGSGFVDGSVAMVFGGDRQTTFVDESTLEVRLMAEDVARARVLYMNVWTARPGGGSSGHQTLRVAPASNP